MRESVCGERAWKRENRSNDVLPFPAALWSCVEVVPRWQVSPGWVRRSEAPGPAYSVLLTEWEAFGSVPPGSGWTGVCCALIGCVCPLLSSLCLGSTPPFHCLLSPFNSTIRFIRSAAAGKIIFFATLAALLFNSSPCGGESRGWKGKFVLGNSPNGGKMSVGEHTITNINKEDLGVYWPTVTPKMYLD